MAKKLYEENNIQEIANAIRETSGSADTYTTEEMPAAIRNLGGGNANFIFADSVEELPDPSTVPEDTVALVPSDDDGSGDITELEQRVAEIERDHTDNTNFVMRMTGLAENPENEGKVYGIKNEEIVAMDLPQGGGTDTVSWNDLTDRPFGDESVKIEWDGKPTSVKGYDVYSGTFYKISDYTPSYEELLGGTLTVEVGGATQVFEQNQETLRQYDGYIWGNIIAVINNEDGVKITDDVGVVSLNFPEKGIYLMHGASNYELTLPNFKYIHKIDKKYLPDTDNGSGGTDITIVNSLDEIPADAPEGAIFLVPIDDKEVITFGEPSNYESFYIPMFGNFYKVSDVVLTDQELMTVVLRFTDETGVEHEFSGVDSILHGYCDAGTETTAPLFETRRDNGNIVDGNGDGDGVHRDVMFVCADDTVASGKGIYVTEGLFGDMLVIEPFVSGIITYKKGA